MKKILIFASFLALGSPIFTQQVNPNTQIGWPTNCSTPGYVYSYQAKSCIPGVGGGTVNPGTTGQLAYYPSNGTAVSGEDNASIAQGGTGASTAPGAVSSLLSNPAIGEYILNCTSTSACAPSVFYGGGATNLGSMPSTLIQLGDSIAAGASLPSAAAVYKYGGIRL